MHPADIKAALAKKGIKLVGIAAECEVACSTVSEVISGRTKSRRVAQQIATTIGKPLSQVWPGRYPTKNQRKRAA